MGFVRTGTRSHRFRIGWFEGGERVRAVPGTETIGIGGEWVRKKRVGGRESGDHGCCGRVTGFFLTRGWWRRGGEKGRKAV